MVSILWLIAVALVLYGVFTVFVKKQVALGIILVIAGFLIGPGGVSVFNP